MKKVVIILLFLALSIVGMAQMGIYKVERFCSDELKADTSKTAKAIRALAIPQRGDFKVITLTIEPKKMVFEMRRKDYKATAKISPRAIAKKQKDNKWYYDNKTVVEKLDDKDYVLRLENGTPIMYLTKLD